MEPDLDELRRLHEEKQTKMLAERGQREQWHRAKMILFGIAKTFKGEPDAKLQAMVDKFCAEFEPAVFEED